MASESLESVVRPESFVGRFAPTPSGRLHIGNLFSFLVAWIQTRTCGGHMLMRIEDLDTLRTKCEFTEQLMRDLDWLGLTWEGSPVFQSQRTESYCEALHELEGKGLVYPCFCSRADLHSASAPHFGEEYVYTGTCRDLTPEQQAARAERHPGALRVKVEDARYSFDDAFQGSCSFRLAECSGDFIIRRSDGVFAYQLAVVVDDAFQGVNSIVRGVDLIASTPRQLYLQDLLGLPHPSYAHVPLIVGEDGRRLAKRDGSASLAYLIDEAKWPPERILGHLAYVAGLIAEDEPASADELARYADLAALNGRERIVWRG